MTATELPDAWPVLKWVLAVAIAGGVTILVLLVVNAFLTRVGKHQPPILHGWLRVRRPLGALVLSIALRVSFAAAADPSTFREVGLHVLLIATIVSAVWFVATLVLTWLEHTQRRVVARKAEDDRGQRRAQTQMLLIRRLVNAAFVIIGLAMVLLTFPGVEQVGATILASAGLLSVVVGIAAQTSLGNVFAGLQLAFTDAIRIGDIVEVDGSWSTVEDITLTYVVVSIWTEQHKVLPSTFFTTQPFVNWSRTGESTTGLIYFELDWRTDFERMRAAMDEYVEAHPAWDKRSKSLIVTDARGDRVTVRVKVTAKDTDDDWELRCDLREHLVVWLREHNPQALPVQRVSMPPYDDVEQPAGQAPKPTPRLSNPG